MKRIYFTGLLLIVFMSFSRGLYAQQEIIKLLPDSDVLGNWTIQDSAETYHDEDLYLYINGGADVYLEYGFEKVVTCRYKNPAANRIHLEIYQMKDIDAAYGIFTLNSTFKGQPMDLGGLSYRYDHYMDVWKGNCFIRCTLTRKEEGAQDTLKMITQSIVDKIEIEGKIPLIKHILDIEGAELRDIKYMRGQIALNNVYNFGHGSIAAFDEAISAKTGDQWYFVFKYDDDRNRREWFASAKGKMHSHRKFTDFVAIEDGFTVKDKYGKTFSFKPYRQFFMVAIGLDWNEAQSVFEQMQTNMDRLYP
ncbi:MAG: hypothetical protein KQI35_02085 [Bacteroidetes bacterium]|nr:hypothetical protein [Bacteroidota bacterium]